MDANKNAPATLAPHTRLFAAFGACDHGFSEEELQHLLLSGGYPAARTVEIHGYDAAYGGPVPRAALAIEKAAVAAGVEDHSYDTPAHGLIRDYRGEAEVVAPNGETFRIRGIPPGGNPWWASNGGLVLIPEPELVEPEPAKPEPVEPETLLGFARRAKEACGMELSKLHQYPSWEAQAETGLNPSIVCAMRRGRLVLALVSYDGNGSVPIPPEMRASSSWDHYALVADGVRFVDAWRPFEGQEAAEGLIVVNINDEAKPDGLRLVSLEEAVRGLLVPLARVEVSPDVMNHTVRIVLDSDRVWFGAYGDLYRASTLCLAGRGQGNYPLLSAAEERQEARRYLPLLRELEEAAEGWSARLKGPLLDLEYRSEAALDELLEISEALAYQRSLLREFYDARRAALGDACLWLRMLRSHEASDVLERAHKAAKVIRTTLEAMEGALRNFYGREAFAEWPKDPGGAPYSLSRLQDRILASAEALQGQPQWEGDCDPEEADMMASDARDALPGLTLQWDCLLKIFYPHGIIPESLRYFVHPNWREGQREPSWEESQVALTGLLDQANAAHSAYWSGGSSEERHEAWLTKRGHLQDLLAWSRPIWQRQAGPMTSSEKSRGWASICRRYGF